MQGIHRPRNENRQQLNKIHAFGMVGALLGPTVGFACFCRFCWCGLGCSTYLPVYFCADLCVHRACDIFVSMFLKTSCMIAGRRLLPRAPHRMVPGTPSSPMPHLLHVQNNNVFDAQNICLADILYIYIYYNIYYILQYIYIILYTYYTLYIIYNILYNINIIYYISYYIYIIYYILYIIYYILYITYHILYIVYYI